MLLQESRVPRVPCTLSKALVLCSPPPPSSSRWPLARTLRAAAATAAAAAAAAAARAAVARAPVAAAAAAAPGLGEVRVPATGPERRVGAGWALQVWSPVRCASPSSAWLLCLPGEAAGLCRWGPPTPASGLQGAGCPRLLSDTSLWVSVEAGGRGPLIFFLQILGRLTLSQSQGK